jgi:hypothetical protein
LPFSSRFWLYAPVTAFLALVVLAAAWWWTTYQAFEKNLALIKGHESAIGITINWKSVDVSGFPFRIDAIFDDLSVTGKGAHGAFNWSSPQFALHALTYGRRKTVYEAAGRQHVSWVGENGVHHSASFLPGTLHASSTIIDGGVAGAAVDIRDAAGDGFRAARLQFHMRRDPDHTDLDVMVRADDWHGPDSTAPLVESYVTLTKAAPLMGFMAGKTPWPEAVQTWHADGGQAQMTKGTRKDLAAQILSDLY